MLISIHSGFMRYKSLAYDQICASYWTIWLVNINEFLNFVFLFYKGTRNCFVGGIRHYASIFCQIQGKALSSTSGSKELNVFPLNVS